LLILTLFLIWQGNFLLFKHHLVCVCVCVASQDHNPSVFIAQGQSIKFTFVLHYILWFAMHFKSWPIPNLDQSRRVIFWLPEKPFVYKRFQLRSQTLMYDLRKGKAQNKSPFGAWPQPEQWRVYASYNVAIMPVTMTGQSMLNNIRERERERNRNTERRNKNEVSLSVTFESRMISDHKL